MALSGGSAPIDFDIGRIMDRVTATSRPIVRRAYADWGKLRTLRGPLLRLGFDQVQTTYVNMSKNTLDMQMCVDALETVLTTETIAAVFLITGDSDFSPLARTLRKHGRRVVGIGWRDKTNDIFRNHCDEFIDYESLPGPPIRLPSSSAGHAARHDRPPRGAERRPAVPLPAAPTSRPFLHDPRYDDPASDDDGIGPESGGAAFSFEPTLPARRSVTRDAPARDPHDIDPALRRLVQDHGPGAHLPAAQFIKALRREFPGFTPLAFGVRTLAEFVAAHPQLERDEESGTTLVVILPGGRPLADDGEPYEAEPCDHCGSGAAGVSGEPMDQGDGPGPGGGSDDARADAPGAGGSPCRPRVPEGPSITAKQEADPPVPTDPPEPDTGRRGWWRR